VALDQLSGDSYDNALAETVNGLYTAKPIHRKGPWRTVEQVELATARWVSWWNLERLHGAPRTIALQLHDHQRSVASESKDVEPIGIALAFAVDEIAELARDHHHVWPDDGRVCDDPLLDVPPLPQTRFGEREAGRSGDRRAAHREDKLVSHDAPPD
jgi:hypothetical protein